LIRNARIEDVLAIVGMIRSGCDEGVFYSRSDSLEEQEEAFRKYAFENRTKGYEILIHQTGNRIQGYVDYQVKRGVGHFLGIYVKADYQRKGIGKRLMKKALEDFKRLGCTRQDWKSLLLMLEQSAFTSTLVSNEKVFSAKTKKRKT